MGTVVNDSENDSSDKSIQSENDDTEEAENRVEPMEEASSTNDQETNKELHFPMTNVVPNVKRKRGRPRKYENYGDVSSNIELYLIECSILVLDDSSFYIVLMKGLFSFIGLILNKS